MTAQDNQNKLLEIYTGPDLKSYFRPLSIEVNEMLELGSYSKKMKCSGFQLRDSQAGLFFDFHNAPKPQYIVYLDAEVQVITSGGERVVFQSGDILFANDTHGAGHSSRITKSGKCLVINS